MPKVMIEVDIPDGWKIPQSEDVKRLVNPDWMASWWHISDIHSIANESGEDEAEEITDDEAREVLRLMHKDHDSNIGINWETIEVWVDIVKQQRKEVA